MQLGAGAADRKAVRAGDRGVESVADQDKKQVGSPSGPHPEHNHAPADEVADTASRRAAGTDVHAYIGRQLRAVYDDVAKQPIPDRFIELMKQLETHDGSL